MASACRRALMSPMRPRSKLRLGTRIKSISTQDLLCSLVLPQSLYGSPQLDPHLPQSHDELRSRKITSRSAPFRQPRLGTHLPQGLAGPTAYIKSRFLLDTHWPQGLAGPTAYINS